MCHTSQLLTLRGNSSDNPSVGGAAVPSHAASEELSDDDLAASPGVQLAALAFSAMPTRAALSISSRLTIVERSRLREGLSRVREAAEQERLDAVSALVRAVNQGVGFPSPAPHDEAKCPFRRIEATATDEIVAVLASCAGTQPLLVATALCHLGTAYRGEIWGRLDQRSAVRPMLSQIPGMSATRTAMYALELRDRIAHRR
jgi:hypothetical protein